LVEVYEMIIEQFRYADVVDSLLQQRILHNLLTIMADQRQSFNDYRIQYFEHIRLVGENFQLSQTAVRVLRKIERYGNVAGSSILASIVISRATAESGYLDVQNDVDRKDLEHYLRSTFATAARADVHRWFGLERRDDSE
jgi:hypothetical protein